MLARTNMHELAMGTTSQNAYYGFVKCAQNPLYSAGGSSGGTGAALGSRQAPAGLGTDTGGSVRIPSSINGLCGLRPTMGRYSQQHLLPLSKTRDTIGPMAHSCEDLELLDEVCTGEKSNEDELPKSLVDVKIGIPKGLFNLKPNIADFYDSFIRDCNFGFKDFCVSIWMPK